MIKMNSNKGSPWCPFSNYKSRLILGYFKLWGAGRKIWGCRKKKPSISTTLDQMEKAQWAGSVQGSLYLVFNITRVFWV